MAQVHPATTKERKWAAFVAGDEHIFFPALIALASLEEFNPGAFDRFMVFNGERKTARMDELLARYGITFLDARHVSNGERVMSLPVMNQGRWPAEISLNWALPEHLHEAGYSYAIRLDYDTLSINSFPTEHFERRTFSVSALATAAETHVPGAAIARSTRSLGIDPTHSQAYNVGVVVFDLAYTSEFRLCDKYCELFTILSEEFPESSNALEQVCFAALAANMDHVQPLSPRLHTRVRVTRNIPPGTSSDTAILHFFSLHKPWKPLTTERLVNITRDRRWPMLPFYRMVWLDYASRIEGFAEFCDQRPYSASEIMSLANTVLLTEKQRFDRLQKSQVVATRTLLAEASAIREGTPSLSTRVRRFLGRERLPRTTRSEDPQHSGEYRRLQYEHINNGRRALIIVFQTAATISDDDRRRIAERNIEASEVARLHEKYKWWNLTKEYPQADYLFVSDYYSQSFGWYVMDSGEWFHREWNAELEHFLEKASYERVIAFGTSKGGSAALLYGMMNRHISHVFSCVPQIEIATYWRTYLPHLIDLILGETDPDLRERELNELFWDDSIRQHVQHTKFLLYTGVCDNQFDQLMKFRREWDGPAPLNIILNTSDEIHGAIVSKHRDLIHEVLFSLVEDRPISHTQLAPFSEDVHVLIP